MRPRRSPSRNPTRRALNFDSPPPRTPSPTRGRRSPRGSPTRRGRNRSPEFSSSLESSSDSPSDFRLALNFDSPNPQSPLSVDRPLPFIPGRVEALLNGGQSSPYRAPPRRRSPRGSPIRRRSPPRQEDNQNLRELQGEISRFDPRRPPSPQEPREEYEVNCINDDDILMVDDFTKGVKEFENDQRVIILEEGTSKRGNCFGQKTLIMSMMALNNGLPTVGPWKAMNVMGDSAVNRYFKLPYPNVWVDLNGLNNILEGWKVLRLKKIKKERIGSQFAVGTLHGHEEQIYTLSKTNSKYQGKNDRVKWVLDEAEDGNPNIYFKVDDGFLHLFYQ